MRRGLASLIMGLSLTVGSLAWSGFAFSSTVLNPDLSGTLASRLLSDEHLHGVLVSRTADALEAQVPESVPVPRQAVETAAEQLLANPAATVALREALARSHSQALNGDDSTVVANTVELNAAGRDALIQAQPELAAVLASNPAVPVVVPGGGLSWLGGLKSGLDHYVSLAALAAAAGMLLAFIVTSDRAGVLGRTAMWAFGNAVFWLVVGFGIPLAVDYALPSSFAVLGGLASIVSEAMMGPAMIMALCGAGLLGLSLILPAVGRRQGAAMLHPTRGRQPEEPAMAVAHRTPTTAGASTEPAPWLPETPSGAMVPTAPPTLAPHAAENDSMVAMDVVTTAEYPAVDLIPEANRSSDKSAEPDVPEAHPGATADGSTKPDDGSSLDWDQPLLADLIPLSVPDDEPSSPVGRRSDDVIGGNDHGGGPGEPMWIEGYGYLDDARVAPFFRAEDSETSDDLVESDSWPSIWQMSE